MIFVLGIERSATTWVANILDHHPQTDVYMEPLSSFNSRFKKWPTRFKKIENLAVKAACFQREFRTLKKHQRFLLTRVNDSYLAWKTDLKLAEFLMRKKLATNAISDFLQLNFHRRGRHIFISKKPPLKRVIKEVRLNFNADLIPYLDDHAQVLVIIREPASCVKSILSQMGKGNLTELKRELLDQYGRISVQTICRYWIESYSALTESLRRVKIPHKIIGHTKLLTNANNAVQEICNFLNLSELSEIYQYLETSNQSGRGKHYTVRSRDALLDQIQKDRKHLYPQLEQELEEIRYHPVLKNFVGRE